MGTQPRNLVTEIRRQLEARIGIDRFELWFSAANSLNVDGTTLTVSAPDEFSMDRIKSTYTNEVDALATDLGLKQVEYRVCDLDPPMAENTEGNSASAKTLALGNLTQQQWSATDAIAAESTGIAITSSSIEATNRIVTPTTDAQNATVTLMKPVKRSESTATAKSEFNSGESDGAALPPSPGSTNCIPLQPGTGQPSSSQKKKWPSKASLKDFVVDPENELVWRACHQVIQNPGELTPLYIFGSPGSGKSHLLEGISVEVKRRRRTSKVKYLTAEHFTSDFVASLKNRTMPMFRKRYRELDFLIIDDVQFLKGKQSTLVEVQHTIEAVVKRGGQVIISADRSPNELDFAGPEFVNRISCGLTTQINPPNESAKVEIVMQLAQARGVVLDKVIVNYIASEISGDVRMLSGAINRIKAYQIVKGKSVTLDEARKYLADLVRVSRKSVSLSEIESAVCNLFGLDQKLLRSSSKVKAISQPRMLAMWLARKYTRAALSEIGEHFGGRSHSTVISAKSKVEKWMNDGDVIGIKHSEFPVQNAIRRIEQELRVG